jgi:hypothetical protein
MLEKVNTVTRPAWATKWYEVGFNVLVTVSIAIGFDRGVKAWLTEKMRPDFSDSVASMLGGIIAAVFFAFLGTWIFFLYGQWKRRGYPKTFVYIFERDTDAFVLGSFRLTCDGDAGVLRAEGCAYDVHGESQISRDAKQNPWHSLNIGASLEYGKVTCYITFEFGKFAERPYRHGLIQFEKLHEDGVVNGLTAYRGRIHAIDEPKEGQLGKLPAYANVYAELVKREIPANEAIGALNTYAPRLLGARRAFQ